MNEFRIFPKVTTSKKELIKHIQKVCEEEDVNVEYEINWKSHVLCSNVEGHYFLNMIYMKSISAVTLTHEVIHHINQILNTLTNTNYFWKIDALNDELCKFIWRT